MQKSESVKIFLGMLYDRKVRTNRWIWEIK